MGTTVFKIQHQPPLLEPLLTRSVFRFPFELPGFYYYKLNKNKSKNINLLFAGKSYKFELLEDVVR